MNWDDTSATSETDTRHKLLNWSLKSFPLCQSIFLLAQKGWP